MLQRTEQWYMARLGKLTASRIADATARIKNGWGAARDNYMAELLVERLTGEPAPHYTNAAMQWGIDQEQAAISAYELNRNLDVAPAGFIEHPDIKMTGASPDGFVATDGLVEFKCPNTATHLDTLLGAPIDKSYIKQMQWQMACTGRAWCDWVSFDPRLPARMQLKIIHVKFDPVLASRLHGDVVQFLEELDAKEAALRETYQKAAA